MECESHQCVREKSTFSPTLNVKLLLGISSCHEIKARTISKYLGTGLACCPTWVPFLQFDVLAWSWECSANRSFYTLSRPGGNLGRYRCGMGLRSSDWQDECRCQNVTRRAWPSWSQTSSYIRSCAHWYGLSQLHTEFGNLMNTERHISCILYLETGST